MESKIFFICLFVFSCTIQTSVAVLKCYKCTSLTNPKCGDLSDKSIQPDECTVESAMSQKANFGSDILYQIGLGTSNNANKASYTPVCLKVESRNSTHVNTVVRGCTVKIPNQDVCETAKSKISGSTTQISFCGICDDKDGCNSGNTLKFIYALVVFGTMISTARLFV